MVRTMHVANDNLATKKEYYTISFLYILCLIFYIALIEVRYEMCW